MNICFLNSGYPNPLVGGVERVTYHLICSLKQKKHRVFCFFLKGGMPAVNEHICSCAVLPVANGGACAENVAAFKKFLDDNHIEVLHIQTELTLALELCEKSSPLNCKVVVANHTAPITLCGTLEDQLRPLLYYRNYSDAAFRGLKAVMRFVRYGRNSNKWEFIKQPRLYHLCDAYVSLSDSYIPEYKKYVSAGRTDKYCVVHNPADCDDHEFNAGKCNRLLWVGRMCFPEKRPDRMIRIWEKIYKKFPDWELYMVGDGDAKAILENYCTRKKIPRVVFTGRKNPDEFYRSAKIICLTSSREGWGMVLTEAMNYGCVPVAYNSYSSLADIVKDGENGYTVKAFSVSEYCAKLQTLMTDEAVRLRMAQNGKKSIQQFSIEKIGSQWEELYRNLL